MLEFVQLNEFNFNYCLNGIAADDVSLVMMMDVW
jgi:hypothetical protein